MVRSILERRALTQTAKHIPLLIRLKTIGCRSTLHPETKSGKKLVIVLLFTSMEFTWWTRRRQFFGFISSDELLRVISFEDELLKWILHAVLSMDQAGDKMTTKDEHRSEPFSVSVMFLQIYCWRNLLKSTARRSVSPLINSTFGVWIFITCKVRHDVWLLRVSIQSRRANPCCLVVEFPSRINLQRIRNDFWSRKNAKKE
jgi:hypothetical protein